MTEVAVRMYRTGGLGDCFLLRLRGAEGAGRTMLIDCGVFMRTPGGSQRMREIAADIRKETGGRLDVVVATHEHWDHLAGFYYARDIFADFEVGQVWMGWTEKPGAPEAEALLKQRRAVRRAVQGSALRLALEEEPRGAALQELLAFNGPPGPEAEPTEAIPAGAMAAIEPAPAGGAAGRAPGASADGPAGNTASILNWLRAKAAHAEYLLPGGSPLSLDGLDGLRIYVLGPPTDPDQLRKSAPKAGQVYGMAAEGYLSGSHAAALLRLDADELGAAPWGEPSDPERQAPFDPAIAIPRDAPGDTPGARALFKRYREYQPWRRIDDLAIDSAELLALKLDEDTNNTSLVLALELVGSGKVLLFPGDAQVGSWLSWESLEWIDPTLGGRRVTGSSLLDRTVLYKVGHHGSHNATAAGRGLELMHGEQFQALLPVYEEQARRKGWEMPAPVLYRHLLEKTSGRILRMDQGAEEELWAEVTIS